MPTQITIKQLVELAKTAEIKNPIEWGELPINEDVVYEVFAKAVYQVYSQTRPEYKDVVLLAGMIKLHVEAYVLKQQLDSLQKTISALM